MSATITATSAPDHDVILASDLAYHMGDRDAYDLYAIEAATRALPAPDDLFVSFRIDRAEFISGEFYKRNCTLTDRGIAPNDQALKGKHNRQIRTINRDSAIMDPSLCYAYDTRDCREHDYAAVFRTKLSIPVFQYHRRKGLAAIIHPLHGFQNFPSQRIPNLTDTQAFAEKHPKVFWRGKLTGKVKTGTKVLGALFVPGDPTLRDDEKISLLRQSTRFSICWDNAGSGHIDAGLVTADMPKGGTERVPLLEPLYRDRVPQEKQIGYRYLLALDGYDAPSSWYWMLNTNSVVMRQESPWETFGDNYFQPWVHFIPIAEGGTDLSEKFLWCERHVAECERITANARAAWAVLFEPAYQLERRKAVMTRYAAWMHG